MKPSSTNPSDLDLLVVEADGVTGPLATLRGVRLLRTKHEEVLYIGGAVSADIARALEAAEAQAARWTDPATPPPVLEACRRILSANGWTLEPSATQLIYRIDPGTRASVDVPLHRSDAPVPPWLRDANPDVWSPDEWAQLLDGDLGPWTMATHNTRVVSICHTPVPATAEFGECGVWTDPAFRGRGYAAATTAAWAGVLQHPERHLFYGTTLDNISSQRAAQRLGLRLLGHQARLRRVEESPPGAGPSP